MNSHTSGFTLIEVTLVIALSGILFAAILPYFTTLRTTWDNFDHHTEIVQNSRVALDYFHRELKQASRIIDISSPSDSFGYIEFEKSDGSRVHIISEPLGTEIMISLEESGVYYPIAGPVQALSFTGLSEDGQETTVNALVKTVEMNIVSDRTYSIQVTLPKDIIESLYYGLFSHAIFLEGQGTIDGDIYAQRGISEAGSSIVVNGSKTTWTTTDDLDFPSYSFSDIRAPYEDLRSYRDSADVVINSDYTFLTNQTYSGLYYIGSRSTATVEKGAVIYGTIVAEHDVIVNEAIVDADEHSDMPAIIAGNDILLQSSVSGSVSVIGTIYALDDVIVTSEEVTLIGNGFDKLAIGAKEDIDFYSTRVRVSGNIMCEDDITFEDFQDVTLVGTPYFPTIAANDDVHIESTGNDMAISGLIFSGDDVYFDNRAVSLKGSVIAKDNIRIDTTISLTYDTSYLLAPPVALWEDM